MWVILRSPWPFPAGWGGGNNPQTAETSWIHHWSKGGLLEYGHPQMFNAFQGSYKHSFSTAGPGVSKAVPWAVPLVWRQDKTSSWRLSAPKCWSWTAVELQYLELPRTLMGEYGVTGDITSWDSPCTCGAAGMAKVFGVWRCRLPFRS